jgi:hypothetical protein
MRVAQGAAMCIAVTQPANQQLCVTQQDEQQHNFKADISRSQQAQQQHRHTIQGFCRGVTQHIRQVLHIQCAWLWQQQLQGWLQQRGQLARVAARRPAYVGKG